MALLPDVPDTEGQFPLGLSPAKESRAPSCLTSGDRKDAPAVGFGERFREKRGGGGEKLSMSEQLASVLQRAPACSACSRQRLPVDVVALNPRPGTDKNQSAVVEQKNPGASSNETHRTAPVCGVARPMVFPGEHGL